MLPIHFELKALKQVTLCEAKSCWMPSIERLKHYTNNILVGFTDTENELLSKLGWIILRG